MPSEGTRDHARWSAAQTLRKSSSCRNRSQIVGECWRMECDGEAINKKSEQTIAPQPPYRWRIYHRLNIRAITRLRRYGPLCAQLVGVAEYDVPLRCSRRSFRRTPTRLLRRSWPASPYVTSIGSRRMSAPSSSSRSKAWRNAPGEITMDNELLSAKIAALEGKRPLAHRRSRRWAKHSRPRLLAVMV